MYRLTKKAKDALAQEESPASLRRQMEHVQEALRRMNETYAVAEQLQERLYTSSDPEAPTLAAATAAWETARTDVITRSWALVNRLDEWLSD